MGKKQEILKLRKEGKSYDEISKLLGCSKGLISYHCGKGQKGKTTARTRKRRKDDVLGRKLETFVSKVRNFRRTIGGEKRGKSDWKFSYNEVLEKLKENPICYLSGRQIDLSQPKTYSLDHKIPPSKGGTNELGNLGLTCKEANQAKSDLLLSEFLDLCHDVLVHYGYKVEKVRYVLGG